MSSRSRDGRLPGQADGRGGYARRHFHHGHRRHSRHPVRALSKMKDGALSATQGHFNVELALEDLAKLAVTTNHKIREFVDEYVLQNGHQRRSGGRRVDQRWPRPEAIRRHGHEFRRQALATEWAVKNKGKLEHKVCRCPRKSTKWVAALEAQTMGISKIDTLTAEQKIPRKLEVGCLSTHPPAPGRDVRGS